MFEKYNLIHIELTKPLTHGSQFPAESNVQALIRDYASPRQSQTPLSGLSTSMQSTSYRITGSFDYLPPSVRKDAPTESNDSLLYLQGFSLMNNTADYYTRREHFDSILLSYTYSGEGRLSYGGKTYTLGAGSGFVIDCRDYHEYHSSADHWKRVDVHFWGSQAVALYRSFHRLGVVSFTYSASAMSRMLEELLEVYTNPSALWNLYVGNTLSDILCSILKKAEKDGASSIPPAYRRLTRYMENKYMQKLSLDELAEQFHISKYHMSREFRRYTGYAPGEYLIMLRVQHATILLAQSDLSIEAVAAQAGFSNMSNFIGQIKKRTGMTPSEFRKMCKTTL